MVNGKTPMRKEVIGISPVNNGVRLKDISYWNRQQSTHLSRVGKTKAELLAKAVLKETAQLEYSMGRLLKDVQRRKNDWKKLSKLRTKLLQCFK